MPKASPPKTAELINPNGETDVSSWLISKKAVKIAVSAETKTAAQSASWIAFWANLRLFTFGQNQAAPRPISNLDPAEVTTRIMQMRS